METEPVAMTIVRASISSPSFSSAQDVGVDAYLAQHRGDTEITGLKAYFTSVIDWINGAGVP